MKASANPYKQINWISTGLPSLDRILGGGIPSRKITELSGNFSVGKSTLALQIVAEAQEVGIECLWCDSEFSFQEEYAIALGVDCDELELVAGRFAEENLDAMEEWADSHKNALIVLDSVGQLLPRQEAEKTADGKTIGSQSRLIATFCRKIVPILAINNIALVVLNHNVMDIMSGRLKTSGGAKLEYAKSIWLMLRQANKRIMKGDRQIGAIIEAEVRKNKVAGTLKQKVELTLIYGEGFSAEADLLQELLDKGDVIKKGNTFWRGNVKLGIGITKAREALKHVDIS